MIIKRPVMAVAATCAVLTTPQAVLAESGAYEAENIRKLDIMLMVTSLRCRTGDHDFRKEYSDFNRNNLHHLNRASAKMRSNLSARYGQRGSKRALDRVSVQMANAYGKGHPWMGCAELKEVASDLSFAKDHTELSKAASMLLKPQRVAIAGVP